MSLIDIIGVELAQFDPALLYGQSIDLPATESTSDVYSFTVAGWVLGNSAEVVAVEVMQGEFLIKTVLPNLPRPDVATAFEGVKKAANCGFWTNIGVLGLGETFEVTLRVVLNNEQRLPLGKVKIKRKPVTTNFQPQFKPALVTSMGRSGSTLLMKLLAYHPQLVGQRLYPYETRVANYWMHMLKVLAEPANHLESSHPDLYFEDHFEIGHNPFYLEPIASDPRLQHWFGYDYTTRLAEFCQQNIESFYQQLAVIQGQTDPIPAYFIEKYIISPVGIYSNFKAANQLQQHVNRNYLSGHIPNLIWELYPQTREIFLVRDFRDLICSMLSFYSRQRIAMDQRSLLGDTAEFRAALKVQIASFLHGYHQRATKGLLVRYEDLVREPVPNMIRLLDYLHLEASPDMVDKLIKTANEESEELKQHRTSANTLTSIDRWHRDLTPEQQNYYRDLVAEAQAEFGYK